MSITVYGGTSRLLAVVATLGPGALVARYRALRARQASREALARLDDHLLADVGLSREQARIEGAKPFWVD